MKGVDHVGERGPQRRGHRALRLPYSIIEELMKKTTSSLLISKIRFPLIKRQRWEGESSDVTGVPPHPHPHPAHLSGLGGGGGKAVCRETGRRFGGVVGLILQYNHAACLGRLAKRFIRKPRGGGVSFLPLTLCILLFLASKSCVRAGAPPGWCYFATARLGMQGESPLANAAEARK